MGDRDISKSFAGTSVEVSKRSQHLLPEVWTSHRPRRDGLQGGQSAYHGLGHSPSRSTQTRIRGTKIPGAQEDGKDNEKVAVAIEMQDMQLYSDASRN